MKKKSTMRTGALVFVLILLIGIITAVGIGSSWFRNWDVRTWYNAWGKNNNGETVALSADGKEINAGGEYAMPKTITFLPLAVSKTGEYVPGGEITLIASLSNTFIKNKFEFSANFIESGTGWETEKNVSDYLQITPSGDDTVKIKALQAFGAPIELKATLQGSDNAATCKIDYLKRPNATWNSLTNPTYIFSNGNYDFGVDCYIRTNLDFGTGTVFPSGLEIRNFVAYVNPDFQNAVKKYLTFDIEFKESGFENQTATAYDDTADGNYRFDFQFPDHSMFIKDFENYSEEQKNAIYYAWYKAYQNDQWQVSLMPNYIYPLLCRFSACALCQGNVTDIGV